MGYPFRMEDAGLPSDAFIAIWARAPYDGKKMSSETRTRTL
jgi:hypothetical protein